LTLITKNMRQLIADRVERSVNRVLGKGSGVVAMLLGLVITMLVQSSSITTSILIPLSAAGVIALRNAYPVTLGANVGTTVTALLAALATGSPDALTVALAHTTFNVMGILILYVPPFVRDVPVHLAEGLANLAVRRRLLALAYVIGAFIVLPLVGIIVFG
jgi:sodium-dependent phosphate cotransporter